MSATPPVRVIAMTIGLPPGDEPREWFACCTETVWDEQAGRFTDGCSWYGDYRESPGVAKSDAARHRRAHADAAARQDTAGVGAAG